MVLKIFFQIIDELERMRVELLYSVGNAVIARTETLQWISDISSHWSEVLYFFALIKGKHGWQPGKARLEFRAKNHVIAALFKLNTK